MSNEPALTPEEKYEQISDWLDMHTDEEKKPLYDGCKRNLHAYIEKENLGPFLPDWKYKIVLGLSEEGDAWLFGMLLKGDEVIRDNIPLALLRMEPDGVIPFGKFERIDFNYNAT